MDDLFKNDDLSKKLSRYYITGLPFFAPPVVV